MKTYFLVICLCLISTVVNSYPRYCERGRVVTLNNDFFVVERALSCPVMISACVDESLCPKPSVINCTEGKMMVVHTGFFKFSDTLSCPFLDSACIDLNQCPRFSSLNCQEGRVMNLMTGFFKISNTLSCPKTKLACVDASLCQSAETYGEIRTYLDKNR